MRLSVAFPVKANPMFGFTFSSSSSFISDSVSVSVSVSLYPIFLFPFSLFGSAPLCVLHIFSPSLSLAFSFKFSFNFSFVHPKFIDQLVRTKGQMFLKTKNSFPESNESINSLPKCHIYWITINTWISLFTKFNTHSFLLTKRNSNTKLFAAFSTLATVQCALMFSNSTTPFQTEMLIKSSMITWIISKFIFYQFVPYQNLSESHEFKLCAPDLDCWQCSASVQCWVQRNDKKQTRKIEQTKHSSNDEER